MGLGINDQKVRLVAVSANLRSPSKVATRSLKRYSSFRGLRDQHLI